MTLPQQSELGHLAELTAQFAGVSLQYQPEKLHGAVRLAVKGEVTPTELWDLFNQVLIGQGFTTVITGLPPVYQVVPLSDAPALGVVLSAEQLAKVPFPPGYGVVIFPLQHLSAEAAAKILTSISGQQITQVKVLGEQNRSVVMAASRSVLRQAGHLLTIIDRPGVVPLVQVVRPQRAGVVSLQASSVTAWASLTRLEGSTRQVDIQVAPDGAQLLLIAPADVMDVLVALVQQLDRSEPIEIRTYRPKFFSIEEVAQLVQQLFKPSSAGGIEIVRDKLTNSLIITATSDQHRRVTEVLDNLDNAPPAARRQVRTFAIRHRQADELAKVLTGLIATGVVRADVQNNNGAQNGAQQPQPVGVAPALQENMADTGVVLTSDTVTNTLIAMGEPRALDQVEALLKQLDQRQPQVDIEVIMVSLSEAQNQSLGVELLKRITDGETTGTVSSLFGLSESTGVDPLARGTINGASGLGGVVLRPGDFAGVVRALETVIDGRQLVRSKVVVNNNAKATIDGVIQESLVSSNSNGVSGTTTSVSGTSDAGTQITITPQISSGDYVTVAYTVSQSAFLGQSTTTDSGTRIPPTKRSDSVSSIASIPDGYVIALGGLSNRGESNSEERVPFLGSIPFLGALFRNRVTGQNDSRFYVFIRVNVMRHSNFSDLLRMSASSAEEAKVSSDVPVLKPQFMR